MPKWMSVVNDNIGLKIAAKHTMTKMSQSINPMDLKNIIPVL
jgi:hypothetical protein